MLTDEQTLEIANKYISYLQNKTNIKVLIYKEHIIRKEYGNIYFYDSKEYIETGVFAHRLLGNAPFLVEKKTGRVVVFGTAYSDDYYIKAYESGTLVPSQDRYWDHETESYSYK
ncbi:MAG: YrhB domain-containing protein [Flavobacterium sp.]